MIFSSLSPTLRQCAPMNLPELIKLGCCLCVLAFPAGVASPGSAQQFTIPRENSENLPNQSLPNRLTRVSSLMAQAADQKSQTYKKKLSEGSAWKNLKPESWLIFDVVNDVEVSIRHATMTVNMITGISKWWDHAVIESRACLIAPTAGSDGEGLGCITGDSSGDGSPNRINLAPGTSIRDYVFEVKWKENGVVNEAITQIDP